MLRPGPYNVAVKQRGAAKCFDVKIVNVISMINKVIDDENVWSIWSSTWKHALKI